MAESPSSRPLVRPRAVSQSTGEHLLLEDVLEPILNRAEAGAICIFGPPGSGKSAALRALSATIPKKAVVQILDEPERNRVVELAERMIVIYSATEPCDLPHLAHVWLAPWGEDEALEYLLAVHRARCASVMTRLRAAGGRDLLDLPEFWTICLDRMAEDESIADLETALRRHLDGRLSASVRHRAREICFWKIVSPHVDGNDEVLLWGHRGFLGFLMGEGLEREEVRLVRDPRVRLLLAAEQLVDPAKGSVFVPGLESRLPEELISRAAKFLRDKPEAIEALKRLLPGRHAAQPMGASLLHATGTGWKPPDGAQFSWFGNGFFRNAQWPGLRLSDAKFTKADLSGANLRGASLDGVGFANACLKRSVLSESSIRRIDATGADLSGADLSRVFARMGTFVNASLQGANLEGALLQEAHFTGADLTKARFCRADLRKAVFQLKFRNEEWMESCLTVEQAAAFMKKKGYKLHGMPGRKTEFAEADFSGADLQEASLQFAELRTTVLDGALLMGADLQRCTLEGATISGARFEGARLHHAVLTGSVMTGASFRGAFLSGARLADVEWEKADLRKADLRKATFHLGTSRCGLVFGEPSEGTRNGFYTDDYADQSYRAPEEIRTANLRGALLEGTDFYLVDLREALYTSEQAEYLRRCGAILETRV